MKMEKKKKNILRINRTDKLKSLAPTGLSFFLASGRNWKKMEEMEKTEEINKNKTNA